MKPIKYLIGDATKPVGVDPKIIAHICNDFGGWGAGFVLALSARDKSPEQSYRGWSDTWGGLPDALQIHPFELGQIQFAPYMQKSGGLYVANMIAQRGSHVDYLALNLCLNELRHRVLAIGASVHMPRIGCGLGGGKWSEIEDIIKRTLCAWNVDVFIYDLAEEKDKFCG